MDPTAAVSRDPQLLKGVLPMLVLALLAEEESYGYQLVTRLSTGGLHGIATGSVYPVLTRLEREGRLTSRLTASAEGPARKYYRLTVEGLAQLSEARRAWTALADVVTRIIAVPEEELR